MEVWQKTGEGYIKFGQVNGVWAVTGGGEDEYYRLIWDASDNSGKGALEFADDVVMAFGTNDDVEISYNNTHGFFITQVTNKNISIASTSSSQAADINIGNVADGKSSDFVLGAKQLLIDGDLELTADASNVSQVVLQPSYSGDGSSGSSGSHSVTYHSYFDIRTPTLNGTNITVSHGLLFNFNGSFASHKCLYAGDKTSGDKDGAIPVHVDGTEYWIQLYATP